MKNLFVSLGISVWVASFVFGLVSFTADFQENEAELVKHIVIEEPSSLT